MEGTFLIEGRVGVDRGIFEIFGEEILALPFPGMDWFMTLHKQLLKVHLTLPQLFNTKRTGSVTNRENLSYNHMYFLVAQISHKASNRVACDCTVEA